MKNVETNNSNYISKDNKQVIQILDILEKEYPDASCSLNYHSPLELTIALILAAQCTDERVNKTLPNLFEKFPDVYSLAKASLDEIAEIIRPCGFYQNKAKSILSTAKIIVEKFNGNVPNTMEDLTSLTGIGRKSANIILQECFDKVEGIAVDTHVTRISRKVGISNGNTQEKIEEELMKKVDKYYWNKINHIFVYHGRAICIAKRPMCNICPIQDLCGKND